MKNYVHARLNEEDQKILRELKKKTGEAESALVKKGLRLVYQKEIQASKSALEAAGDLVGKYSSGYHDLSTNRKHFEGFGK